MFCFFFFNDTATPEIYPLSLHDALPIWRRRSSRPLVHLEERVEHQQHDGRHQQPRPDRRPPLDRKSTRLNSSHSQISYAVFCLKKKKKTPCTIHLPQSSSSCLYNTYRQR